MTRNKPPFRADVVGSLLRSAPLKEARAKREKGETYAERNPAAEANETTTGRCQWVGDAAGEAVCASAPKAAVANDTIVIRPAWRTLDLIG